MTPFFTLRVLTPSGQAYLGEVEHVRVPVLNGSVGVLANHAPYVTYSAGGTMRIREKGAVEEKIFSAGEGFFEIARNEASFLTRSFETEEL